MILLSLSGSACIPGTFPVVIGNKTCILRMYMMSLTANFMAVESDHSLQK